jgi:large subunit ribosomal protein L25
MEKLKASIREANGKGAARRLRAEGKIPGVVYGHGMDPVAIAIDGRELFHTLHTEAGSNVLIELRVGEEEHLTMPREIQRDHVRGLFIHVDFLAVRRDEKITVDVPVELVGESHGVKEGGVVEHHLWEIKVECFPTDVPDRLEGDITKLGIGDALRVSELELPPNVTLLTDPEETVVSVVPPPILVVEEEEAAEGEEGVEGAEAEEGEGATGEEAGEGGGAAGSSESSESGDEA